MDQNDTTPAKGAKGNSPQGKRRRQPKAGASVQMQVQHHIGRQLRAVYDDLVSRPVPDRFLELLAQLDRQSAPGTPGGASAPQAADTAAPDEAAPRGAAQDTTGKGDT